MTNPEEIPLAEMRVSGARSGKRGADGRSDFDWDKGQRLPQTGFSWRAARHNAGRGAFSRQFGR
jgi:hypothetical protein